MKYITVSLTEDQLDRVIAALDITINYNHHVNPDFQKTIDANNAFTNRLIDKLAKAKSL